MNRLSANRLGIAKPEMADGFLADGAVLNFPVAAQ